MYVRPELIKTLTPTITGWFGQQNPFAFDVKHFDPATSARRFEIGSPPVPNVYAIPAAIELLESVGAEKIGEACSRPCSSVARRRAAIKDQGPRRPADSRGPLVVLQMKDSEAMVKKLAAAKWCVRIAWTGLRISFHLYNTSTMCARFSACSKRIWT